MAWEMFSRAAAIEPRLSEAYRGLGEIALEKGEYVLGEEMLRKSVELLAPSEESYAIVALGRFYLEQKRYSEAMELLRNNIIRQNRFDDNKIVGLLKTVLFELHRENELKPYLEFAQQHGFQHYSPITIMNYHLIREMLKKRKIKHVCMQYPMRDVNELRRIFSGNEEGIIFIDNEKIFKEAVQRDGYEKYFEDMFAGDFGHCTEEGNRLIAQNIADTIIREVFKK